MGIYPVKIKEWYVEGSPFGSEIEMLKFMLSEGFCKCKKCGKDVEWENGWVMHSITFVGEASAWCGDDCLGLD